jgi:hypothetical protein
VKEKMTRKLSDLQQSKKQQAELVSAAEKETPRTSASNLKKSYSRKDSKSWC